MRFTITTSARNIRSITTQVNADNNGRIDDITITINDRRRRHRHRRNRHRRHLHNVNNNREQQQLQLQQQPPQLQQQPQEQGAFASEAWLRWDRALNTVLVALATLMPSSP